MRLILVGFLVIFLGFILVIAGSLTSAPSAGVGGVVLIGPIPIFFGEGPSSYAGDFVVLGIVLTIIAVAFFLLNVLLLRSFRRSM
ncbi:TIGR00304 family membrane protein [Sulfuracidifex metallicus]|uniref:DUF131 domain-containing protein n=1 Tax=Sulfuracidifex metallicus DSM 6482 = JCM 9184 TaxID=523847 RepID=A0A6A9QRV1_SULME|nr:DUF131 domain-containing protein [Sulfuracidifex metallicus]MUN30045.1 DUF131 domain-containing protein [Sulfuracidifex metallicus DSM 6482 = JCM 9184]WOE51575.1 DUF131 domain-containing protein [Sulfuracidifex metallicus DSM 6482 = JCM 9184]